MLGINLFLQYTLFFEKMMVHKKKLYSFLFSYMATRYNIRVQNPTEFLIIKKEKHLTD